MLKEDSGNKVLANSASALASMRFLELKSFQDYLGADYFACILAFSKTCKAARNISSDVIKKHALQRLSTALKCYNLKLFRSIITAYPDFLDQKLILTTIDYVDENLFRKLVKSGTELLTPTVLLQATVYGNEDVVREIVTSRPDLLLDNSATVTDLSGKEITNLTPPQAALCAGDVDMLHMIKKVLQQKLQEGITLNFEPEAEIRRQISSIYPEGLDAVETAQKKAAKEFNDIVLTTVFFVINTATYEQVLYELNNPGQNNPNSLLNTTLHNFRKQFAAKANQEQIFNPFYLLKAIEFFDEKYHHLRDLSLFIDIDIDQITRRSLFWCQIIGYIQSHLPACYLQAFAQGIYPITENNQMLNRDFNFTAYRSYMRPNVRDLDGLGYKWAAGRGGAPYGIPGRPEYGSGYTKFIANKKIRFRELTQPGSPVAATPEFYLPTRCVIT